MSKLRVLLVDDEAHARRRMRMALRRASYISIVGEAEDAAAALIAVATLHPDLILLDIQMPGESGLELVKRLPPPIPSIIFVTAHDDHALAAFKAHAVDYILKPYSETELLDATLRVVERKEEQQSAKKASALLATIELLRKRLADHENPPVEFWVENRGRHIRLLDHDLEWIAAEGDFIRLHTIDGSHLLCDSLSSVANRLRSRGFERVHRGAVVRLAAVEAISPSGVGAIKLTLRGGASVKVGRKYQKNARRALRGDRGCHADERSSA